MEAIGRSDKGLGGTGWQARSKGILATDGWQPSGCDNPLAAENRQKINVRSAEKTAEKKPLDAGERRGKFNGEEGRCDPNDQRDGDAPVGRTTAGAMRDRCLLKAAAAHETPALPWAETTAVDAEDAANPSGRTGISGDPERCVLVAGRTAAPPARRDGWALPAVIGVTSRNKMPQANIQPTAPGGISATTSPHCVAHTMAGSGAGALYEEPDT